MGLTASIWAFGRATRRDMVETGRCEKEHIQRARMRAIKTNDATVTPPGHLPERFDRVRWLFLNKNLHVSILKKLTQVQIRSFL